MKPSVGITDDTVDADTLIRESHRRVKRAKVRLEFKAADFWVGVFVKRKRWWGGFIPMDRASTSQDGSWEIEGKPATHPDDAHSSVDVWVCLLPMLPIHYRRVTCPRDDECKRDHRARFWE